jgi:hypothetical protein
MTSAPPRRWTHEEVASLRARAATVKPGVPTEPVDMLAIRRAVFRLLFPYPPK